MMGVDRFTLLPGDCMDRLRDIPDASVDACVTDPPYGYNFMGKHWDAPENIAFRWELWAEVKRVLKPGGHVLAASGTRTYHRLAVAIEEAEFEIRDQVLWIYGQGFPKGLNVVNNLIELALCQSRENAHLAVQCSASSQVRCDGERGHIAVALAQTLPEGGLALLTEIGGEVALHAPMDTWPSAWMERIGLSMMWSWNGSLGDASQGASKCITATAAETTIDPKTFNWLIGLHTSGITTRCDVTLRNGSPWPAIIAETNLNAARANRSATQIVTALGSATSNPVVRFDGFNVALKPACEPFVLARKPLIGTVAENVLAHGTGALNVDGCRVSASAEDVAAAAVPKRNNLRMFVGDGEGRGEGVHDMSFGRWPANVIHDGSDEATSNLAEASRYFYAAKASKRDRAGSKHPTVKPISLMRYLCRLITPPGGLILDPFAGTGTTGEAALLEGFRAILIEREPEYQADIRRRMEAMQPVQVALL